MQVTSSIIKKYEAEMLPNVASRHALFCRFADAIPDLGEHFLRHDHITNNFLKPIRPAIESIRGFLRFPEERRNRKFESLFTERAAKWFVDHSRDEAFDSRFICQGLSDTGLILVYSFDSSKVDLTQLFTSLWDVQVLDNPATAVGRSAVDYARRIPDRSDTIRFAFTLWGYDDPNVLIYASRDRIEGLFSLALRHSSFSRHFAYRLSKGYGR